MIHACASIALLFSLQTTSTATIPGSVGAGESDVAYDATNDVYLADWEKRVGARSNVYAHRLNAQGDPIALPIVVAASRFLSGWPKVANVSSSDRFLIGWGEQGRAELREGRSTMKLNGTRGGLTRFTLAALGSSV